LAEPQTVNTGLIVPNTGDLVGTWGSAALNPDFVAVDGYLGGVQTLSITNANVTLTAPAGFTATPSPGPTQAQNAVLRLTGVQTGNVVITLPLPGYYIVENLLTGNVGWIVTLQSASAGNAVICIDRGMCQHVYNDGTNVKFVNLGATGQMEMWAGYSSIPAWVFNCTFPPYLLCDGGTYPISSFPALGNRLGSTFGGNGVTSFGVPDLRGRVPLAYDGTGGRITAAGCGLNGQSLGASIDTQIVTLTAPQVPSITSSSPGVAVSGSISGTLDSGSGAVGGGSGLAGGPGNSFASNHVSGTFSGNTATINVTSNNTSGQGHPNVQPSQVAGIWVIRSA